MSEMPPVAIAALALLCERPMHPYEMFQTLRERHEDGNLSISVGSLYHAVAKLEEKGRVRAVSTEQVGNRPERTTYEILPSGVEAMRARIDELLRQPAPVASTAAVAVAEIHHLRREDAVECLRARVAALDDDLEQRATLLSLAADRKVPEVFYLAGPYTTAIRQAERDWIAGLLTRIERGDLTWPPTPTA